MKHPTPTWRRLLAAALLSAALLSPARADDDSSTAEGARKAVVTGNFDSLYTGSRVYRESTTGTLPVPVPPTPPLPSGGNGADGTLQSDGAIGQADIDKCLIMDSGSTPQQQAFYRQMTAKLQTSPTGRRTLAAMTGDCQKNNDPVRVAAVDFPGSAVVNNEGVEDINGIVGQSRSGQGQRYFHFNKKLNDFKDQNAALQAATANMGHELTHIITDSFFHTELPEYEDLLGILTVDEQSARTRGHIDAYEINDGKVNGNTLDAAEFVKNPQAYLDRMKLWDPIYAITLQQKELRDPIPVYRQRVALLTEKKKDLQEEKDHGLPDLLQQIDHMTGVHAALLAAQKLAERVGLMRPNVVSAQGTISEDIADAQKSIDRINEMLQKLTDPNTGPALLARLKALSTHPKYAEFMSRHQADEQRLDELVRATQLTAVPIEKQPLGRDEFVAVFKKTHNIQGQDPIPPPPWNEPKTP